MATPATAPTTVMGGESQPVGATKPVKIELQRILNTPDLLPGSWFLEGAVAADAVAMLNARGTRGTGFLVSPWLLLTNNHVLPDPRRAAGAVAVFRYVADDDNRITGSCELRLAPERCFVTSPVDALDYTLVALAPLADGRAPGEVFGSIPMRAPTAELVSGQPVNIIQHPSGRPREIAVRNNRLIGVDDERYLTYETDSEPGSSGSPVLNDEWELVALHSRSESRLDSAARQVWVANVGIRTSAILADVARRADDHGIGAAALLDEMLRSGSDRRG